MAAKAGRPSKLTPAFQQVFFKAIEIGGSMEEAAAQCEVDVATVYVWMRAGRENKAPHFVEFYKGVQEAKHRGTLGLLGLIHKAAIKDWKAAAWKLERKEPARFAQRVRVTIEQELTDAVDKLEQNLTAEEFEKVSRILLDGHSAEAGEREEPGAEGPDDSDGEAVRPSRAKPKAENLP